MHEKWRERRDGGLHYGCQIWKRTYNAVAFCTNILFDKRGRRPNEEHSERGRRPNEEKQGIM